MNETRLTLISDATQEYPNKTNVDFKIRLAEPIHLKGEERWHAAMISLSTPNRPSTLMGQLELGKSDTLFVYGLRIINPSVASSHASHLTDLTSQRVSVGDVFGESLESVTGTEFWSRIVYYCKHFQSQELFQSARINNTTVKSYDDEMVLMELDPLHQHVQIKATVSNTSPSTFGLNLTVAKYFGLIEESRAGGYNLGPNSHYETTKGYDSGRARHTAYWPVESDMRSDTNAMATRQLSTGENLVYFSRHMNWTFGNLNRTFGEAAKIHKTQLALIYCDLVQSTLVGNQKHPLLRELTLKDSGGSRQSVEPLHYQWLPVRNNVVEVVHVQLAEADGKLLKLPVGKTMVTVSLKHA